MYDKKIKVAVSGAGGGVGQSIIKSLYGTEYEVVALDSEPLGTGLYATNTSYVIPYATSTNYIDRLIDICEKENCRLFFPGLDAELPVIAEAAARFESIGTKVIVSSIEAVRISDDKLLTYSFLTSHGINVPLTVDVSDYLNGQSSLPEFPLILKQRIGGARSQGIHTVGSKADFDKLMDGGLDLKNYVAQSYVDGDEYTCGTVNFAGKCQGVIVMKRILRDGDTYKCFSVKDKLIEKAVTDVADALQPFGACNVQLRMKQGVPYIFEINARCSGTSAARTLCGFNEPKMIADYVCHGLLPTYTIREQTVLRYWKELVVDNDKVKALELDEKLLQKAFIEL